MWSEHRFQPNIRENRKGRQPELKPRFGLLHHQTYVARLSWTFKKHSKIEAGLRSSQSSQVTMSEKEQFDLPIIGSGEAGKNLAWAMARA